MENRKIKFRAWDKELKVMKDFNDLVETSAFWEGCFDDKTISLMQYTGLNDKREKEAYFGDLIRWGNSTYLIDWDKENAKTVLLKQNGTEIFNTLTVDQITKSEIIGNIMENPQLKL